MADNEIDLKVKISPLLDSAQKDFENAKQRGATKVVANSERDFNILKNRIIELSEVAKPTNKQLQQLDVMMKQLNTLLTKLGNASGTVSNATKEMIKRQEELNKARAKESAALEKANRRLSKKDNDELSLKNSEQEQYISGLKRAKGGRQVSLSSFQRMGQLGDFSSLANPTLGAQRWKELQNENLKVIEQKKTAEANLAKINADELELQSKIVTVNAGDEIVVNASNRNSQTEKIISGVKEGRTDPNSQPTESGSLTNTLDKQSSSLGKAFKQFSIYALAIRAVRSTLREVKKTVVDLDKYLTEQAMVTGKTREETYKLLQSYQDLAKATGATTKEVAEVATQFMRQGKTAQEALTLTEAAVKAAKVAAISTTDSVTYLTTALNGFRLSANDAMKVSDKFAAIAAQSASSYEEIAIALSKVASQANLAGMSIDYTTALLAKGLETTREAPETIGTALKTIIARMRELTDYGETLEDGMDLNNVETQLSYVGIALRDQNGELRSTEDVLDDLGKKWDTLNNNQQAAVAKALAGTRQQSRLIAMMQDYERVTELQEISQRSAGATAAQASIYMEGIEATINKIKVAIEGITTSLAKNNIIIGVLNTAGRMLDNINKALKNSVVNTMSMIALWTIVVALIAKTTTSKIKNNALNKIELGLEREKTLEQLKQQALEIQKNINNKIDEAENTKKLILIQAQTLEYEKQLGIHSKGNILRTIWNGLEAIALALGIKKVKYKEIEVKKEEEITKQKIAQLGLSMPMLILYLAIAAVIGAILLSMIDWRSETEKVTESVNKLSNEIYELNKKASEIDAIIDSYDELDKKIIKTQEDQKKMNELLENAGDSLSDEEQEAYNKLESNISRKNFLEKIRTDSRNQANKYRQDQLNELKRLSPIELKNLLSGNATEQIQVQDAVFAINNNTLYEYIDTLDDVKEGTESFTQSILENLSALDAYNYATNANGKSIEKLVDIINSATTSIDGNDIAYAKILNSDDYSFSEKIDAYQKLHEVIASMGDPILLSSFEQTYSQWEKINEVLADSIDYIDKLGITIDEINDLSKAIQSLGYSVDESAGKLNDMFQRLEAGGDLESTIKTLFAKDLAAFDYGSEEWKATYNKILNAYQLAVGQGALNMGQNLTQLTNQINGFYDKVAKWPTMTEQEKTEFMSDNYKLFQGEQGQALYKAFETGDYNQIQKALANNEALKETIKLRLQELQIDLDIEKARRETGDANEAYIAELEKNIKELQDYENETSKIYQASLELRLEQEKSQLDIYKDYLSKQQKALEESLNKRKDAYQKYFDAVNQESEDEDYEDQANLLISNLQKLSSSTDANSLQQSKELEKKLQDLEKERLQTLRERAQEAVISNIDDEVSQINDKFDELLESNQAMLFAMRGDAANANSFIANTLSTNLQGKSALEAESYIQDFKAAYGSILPSNTLNDISIKENGDQLILNIAGTEIQIGESVQQDLYSIIMNALKQQGLR